MLRAFQGAVEVVHLSVGQGIVGVAAPVSYGEIVAADPCQGDAVTGRFEAARRAVGQVFGACPPVAAILAFMRAEGSRGLCRPRDGHAA